MYRQLFVRFLLTVAPWFDLDISQGCITLRLRKEKAFSAEVRTCTRFLQRRRVIRRGHAPASPDRLPNLQLRRAEAQRWLQVYAHTLGVPATDDLKYVYGVQLLQAALEILRAKGMGRSDVEVCPPPQARRHVFLNSALQ